MMNASTSIQRTSLSRRSTRSLVVTFVAALFAAIVLLLVAVERTDAQVQGELWAWGRNDYGQLGDGTTTQRNTPVQVSGLSDVKAIAGGFYHSLALKNDGTVWAWGSNKYSQLGDGTTTTNSSTPVQVSGLSDVKAISSGGYHGLALKNDGTLWAWGRNDYGQLGDDTTTQRNTPVQVRGLSGVQAIDGGGNHSLAVTSSDTMSPPPDPVPGPPTVESTIPNANEKGVAGTIDIKATFSEDMNGDTITGNTFKLFKKGSTTKIAAAAPSYDAATKTATLNPNRDLTSGVTYKAVVTTGVEDTAGNPLDQDSSTTGLQQKAWLFTVR